MAVVAAVAVVVVPPRMQARVRVLDEQEHRLLRRACSDVATVLLSTVSGFRTPLFSRMSSGIR